jgi:uncharacterized protein
VTEARDADALAEAVRPDLGGLRGVWPLRQGWQDVTFVHWAIDPALVADRFPAGTRPDVYDGVTYVGLVAFRMVDVGFGPGLTLPPFEETNVRLYSVDQRRRRGVFFLSLDTDSRAFTYAARAAFALPYRLAEMRLSRDGDRVRYRHQVCSGGPSLALDVRTGGAMHADERDHFLTARWRVHSTVAGRTWLAPTHHEPWPLRHAEVRSIDGDLLAAHGLGALIEREPDQVAYSPGVHARFRPPVLLRTAAPPVTARSGIRRRQRPAVGPPSSASS